MQGATAVRVNANPVPLQAAGAGLIPLIDGDIDARALQPVSQAEPARASTNDQDAQRFFRKHQVSSRIRSRATGVSPGLPVRRKRALQMLDFMRSHEWQGSFRETGALVSTPLAVLPHRRG